MLLEIIKDLCLKEGITITELERVLGFGNGTMHKWGKGGASTENVYKVAEYFGVSMDYLMGKENDLPTHEAMDIAKLFDGLTDSQKNLVRCYMSIVKADRSKIQ